MTVSALTSEVDSREDMKRLHFRRLKCHSSAMNPLDSGRLLTGGAFRGIL